MSEKILGLTFWTKILPANQIACFFKGAEATLTNTLTKNSNIVFFLQQTLPTLPMIMLGKYFQICMYIVRENWKINPTLWHTVLRFNL